MSNVKIIDKQFLTNQNCFNGSIFIRYKNDDDSVYFSNYLDVTKNHEIYCVYRSTPTRIQCFDSTLCISKICLQEYTASSLIKLYEHHMKEDPRVFCMNDKILVTYSEVIERIRRLVIKLHGTVYDKDFNKLYTIDFTELNKYSIIQKNWTFFEEHNITHVLYNVMPLEIYLWDKEKAFYNIIKRKWSHPLNESLILRGGCPPIKIDDLYYVFIHSTNYEIYCMILDCYYFSITKVTKIPIIENRGKKLDIHFPCGAIYDNKDFIISCGIDDENLALITISKEYIDSLMIDVTDNSLLISESSFINSMKSSQHIWINSFGGCGNDQLGIYLRQNGINIYSQAWDIIGCHYIKYHNNITSKKIYIITDPICAIEKTFNNNNMITNLKKLSNQKEMHNYSLTALSYFMLKQVLTWLVQREDVLIIYEKNISSTIICDFLSIKLPNEFIYNFTDKVMYANKLIDCEGQLCKSIIKDIQTRLSSFLTVL